MYPVHCCHSSLPGRYASAAYTPVCGGTTGNMPRIPGGGFLECCAMLRAGLVALRRFGVSVWFALVRIRGDLKAVSLCTALARLAIPGVRRYASVCAGSGFPVWLVMVRFAGGRGCVASRHLLRPVEEPGLIWRVFSRGSRSENTGPSRFFVSLCRAMSRRLPERSPGREKGLPGVTSCRQGRGSSPPLPAVLDRLPEGLASEGLSFVGKDPFLQGHQLDFVPGSPSVRTAEV